MSCDEDHCITCSDEAVAMSVREVRADGIAVCDDGTEVMLKPFTSEELLEVCARMQLISSSGCAP